MKAISITGYHHSGKTTLTCNLINELKKRGYSVASIKDIHSEKFTMEKEGSNSWKHLQANNNVVFARGLSETYQIWNRQLTFSEMKNHLQADYLIIEGMKHLAVPRIICARNTEDMEELVNDTVMAISGIIVESDLEIFKNRKLLHSTESITEIADLVEKETFEILPYPEGKSCGSCGLSCFEMVGEILSKRKSIDDCVVLSKKSTKISINGKELKIGSFVKNIFEDSVIAFLKNLKGYKDGEIKITINKEIDKDSKSSNKGNK